jgi:hypothetical protein
MFMVSVGYPEHEPAVVVKQFEKHEDAMQFAVKLDELLGVKTSHEVNEEGVCALIDEFPF